MGDVDEFLRNCENVENLVKGLVNGRISVNDPIFSENTEYTSREDVEPKTVFDNEEREAWWGRAKILNKDFASDESNIKQNARKSVDTDYSRWEKWIPDDPVSKEEATIQEETEALEFQKNNPDFCAQFERDMLHRTDARQLREKKAEDARKLGNICYSNGNYKAAIKKYAEALTVVPYDLKTLLNLAQVFIKLNDFARGDDFVSRVLYLDPINVKGMYRKAVVLKTMDQLEDALIIVDKALFTYPKNHELITLRREIEELYLRRSEERLILPFKETNKIYFGIVDSVYKIINETLAAKRNGIAYVMNLELPVHSILDDENLRKLLIDGKLQAMDIDMIKMMPISRVLFELFNRDVIIQAYGNYVGLFEAIVELSLTDGFDSAPRILQGLTNCRSKVNRIVEAGVISKLTHLCQHKSLSVSVFSLISKCIELHDTLLVDNIEILRSVCLILTTLASNDEFVDTIISGMDAMSIVCTVDFVESIRAKATLCMSAIVVIMNSMNTMTIESQLLSILLKFSLKREFLVIFCEVFPLNNIDDNPQEFQPSAVRALLKLYEKTDDPAVKANVMIVLSNAASDSTGAVKASMIECEWHKRIIMDVCNMTQSNVEGNPHLYLRTMGLLSKMINIQKVTDYLLTKEEVILRIIKSLIGESDIDQLGSLLQIVAALSVTKHRKVMDMLRELQLFSALARALPVPTKNHEGKVDELSITKIPDNLPTSHVIGNISLCMISCLDDANVHQEINEYCDIVDKVICSFVSYPDVKVRKNLAIVLAKLSRYPKLRDRISQLRGMEMLRTVHGVNGL